MSIYTAAESVDTSTLNVVSLPKPQGKIESYYDWVEFVRETVTDFIAGHKIVIRHTRLAHRPKVTLGKALSKKQESRRQLYFNFLQINGVVPVQQFMKNYELHYGKLDQEEYSEIYREYATYQKHWRYRRSPRVRTFVAFEQNGQFFWGESRLNPNDCFNKHVGIYSAIKNAVSFDPNLRLGFVGKDAELASLKAEIANAREILARVSK